jgi:LacI family transcriptional regulator
MKTMTRTILKTRITRIEVAKKAGVSPSTVTRALNDHPGIPEKTRKRIKALSKKLGYVPSQLARGYFQKKSFRIGMVIPMDNNDYVLPYEYFSKTTAGVIKGADAQNYTVSIIKDDPLKKNELANLVNKHSVDGMIFVSVAIKDTRFSYLHRHRIPFVFIHHYCRNKPYVYVDCDSYTGMKQSFEYIRKKNIKKIGFLGGGNGYVNSIDRKRIFKELSGEYNMTVTKVVQGNYSRQSGFRAAQDFLKGQRPQLIFCANDRMALGLLQSLAQKNIMVPQHIKIIGFDNQEISRISVPPITTIENPFFEIGEKAADKLIALIKGERVTSESPPSRLIVRETA